MARDDNYLLKKTIKHVKDKTMAVIKIIVIIDVAHIQVISVCTKFKN